MSGGRASKHTINSERGSNGKILDRFDLTFGCIGQHYAGEASPLGDTLDRYGDFFALFGNFDGYVGFLLLQDLVSERGRVEFFLLFDGFVRSPLPQSPSEYKVFRENSTRFVEARNRRIAQAFPSGGRPWQAAPGGGGQRLA